MRVGADSAPESLLRLAITDAGLPEPELQVPLRTGDARSPSADLGYRHRRIAIQYDGGHHLGDAQIFSDRRRDKAFESAGWTVLVFGKEDLADDFQRAVAKIKRAVRNGWVDHPQASGFAQLLTDRRTGGPRGALCKAVTPPHESAGASRQNPH